MTITKKVVSDEQLAGLMKQEIELFKNRTPKSERYLGRRRMFC